MRVLIVDRSALIVKRLEEMLLLTEITKNVYSSDCYSIGLEIFEICNPEVVLMGIGIPEEKSMKLLNSIKTLNSAIPVIILPLNINEYMYAPYGNPGADYFPDKYNESRQIPDLIQRIAVQN